MFALTLRVTTKTELMHGPVTLEKRKIERVFVVNNHIPLSLYKGSDRPYSKPKFVSSFFSSQGLVYRFLTWQMHKIQFTGAETSDTELLTILIALLK